MKKYFVPYSIALKLKEKGFVEECWASYDCALTSKKDKEQGYSGSFGWKKGECNFNKGYFLNNSPSDYSSAAWISVGAPIYQQVIDWLWVSSETIFSIISGQNIRPNFDYMAPSDPDDFRRCYLLLKAVPEFKEMLYKMKPISHEWDALVDNWDRLTELLEEQMKTKQSNGMYDLMQSLFKTKPVKDGE